jgi:hypothetical protein
MDKDPIIQTRVNFNNEGKMENECPTDESLLYELRKPKQIEPNKGYPALFLIHGE